MSKWSELSEWDRKNGSIGLSKERRARLREFAEGVGENLTKAEAIYELIDTALPLIKQAPPNPHADAVREIAERSADALERVAASLAPLTGLISVEGSGEGRTGPTGALGPKAWIEGLLARLGTRPAMHLTLTLRWKSSARSGTAEAEFIFTVARIQFDERVINGTARSLPMLTIRLDASKDTADISLAALLDHVDLVCRPISGGWACELRHGSTVAAARLVFGC